MKRTLFLLVAMMVVLTAGAQEAIRMRNCHPVSAEVSLSGHNTHRVPAILGSGAADSELRAPYNNPYIGDRRQLVVLAAFSDQPFKGGKAETLELWNKIFNTENYSEEPFHGSVHDYFLEQSYGQLRLTFDLFYVVVNSMVKYHSTDWDDENSKYLVQDIMKVLKDEVDDWAPYDWDGDGYVNQLMIIFSGKGQNAGGGANTIWPHQYTLSEHSGVEPITFNSGGKEYTVDSYCCVQELNLDGGYGSFGTICHEYSHCFGLPDFYDGSTTYVYTWDIMDYGNNNHNGLCPCGYSAFERTFMGWMTPVELNSDTTLTAIPALGERPQAYLIRNEGEPQEYYLVENRQQQGWDTYLPGSGIVVFHIDYDDVGFNYLLSQPNTSKRQRYTIFAANDKSSYPRSYASGWAYPYNRNNELTNTSTPAATLKNPNFDGTLLMSKPITAMAVVNGMASFSFMNQSTGIRSVSVDSLDMDDDNLWFTVDGRGIVGRPVAPGLYLNKGKLVLIK